MTNVLLFSYSILLSVTDFILSLWPSEKLKKMYAGRKETHKRVLDFIKKHPNPVWIHCASLGEFEQGRPLIEEIKSENSKTPIVLSFFSPSGYEIKKNYPYADLIVYLPADTLKNAKWVSDVVRPKLFIFVKYEFWWNLIHQLVHSPTKTILISGVFRHKDYFFNPILTPFKSLLGQFDKLFVQDQDSAKVLQHHNILNFEVVGDTRIDSVLKNAETVHLDDKWHQWMKQNPVIIYGSVWDSDMDVVKASTDYFSEYVHIIAPHDVSFTQVKRIETTINKEMSYWDEDSFAHNIIMVNTIGLLKNLYKIADYVYIGGGFHKGIHNILEPASYGVPVFFGPHHKKFNEATTLKNIGQGHAIHNFNTMKDFIEQYSHHTALNSQIKKASKLFFEQNKGATHKIIEYITPTIKK